MNMPANEVSMSQVTEKCMNVQYLSSTSGHQYKCLQQAGCCAVWPLSQDGSFLEDINNILNAGEVPNMFAADEKMQILEAVRPAAAQMGLESPLQLWSFFVQQCRRNLHVVLCMSPVGDAFRSVALHPHQAITSQHTSRA